MKDAQTFWDGVAPRYARKTVKDPTAYEHTLARTRTYLGAEDKVLEVGCGTGTTALRLADGVGEIVASDLSGAMIALAEDKARAAGAGNVRFVRAAVSDTPREADGFDAVLAFHVLHLVDDLPAVLGALAARLRPGGMLVSKTVCLGEMGRPIRALVRAMRAVGLAPPVANLTAGGLERAIAAAGFEIVETGLFPKRPPSRFVVARKV